MHGEKNVMKLPKVRFGLQYQLPFPEGLQDMHDLT